MKLYSYYVLAHLQGSRTVVLHCASSEEHRPLVRGDQNAFATSNPQKGSDQGANGVTKSFSRTHTATYFACGSRRDPIDGPRRGRPTRSEVSSGVKLYKVDELRKYFQAIYASSESIYCADAGGNPIRVVAALCLFGRS